MLLMYQKNLHYQLYHYFRRKFHPIQKNQMFPKNLRYQTFLKNQPFHQHQMTQDSVFALQVWQLFRRSTECFCYCH